MKLRKLGEDDDPLSGLILDDIATIAAAEVSQNEVLGILAGTPPRSTYQLPPATTPRMEAERSLKSHAMRTYFEDGNTENIRNDLQKFATIGKIDVIELSVSKPGGTVVLMLSNQMEMSWKTFLNHASRYLLGTDGSEKNPHKIGEALDNLSEMIGIVRINKAKLRETSFNSENSSKNLQKFAEAGGINIEELSTNIPKPATEVTLLDGRKMKWQTFLSHASMHFLLTKGTKKSPHRQNEALNKLCETIGITRVKKGHS